MEINKKFTTPFETYVLLFIFSILLMAISEIAQNYKIINSIFKDVLGNIAVGVLASAIVAAFVDYCTTLTRIRKDRKEALFFTAPLKRNIENLFTWRILHEAMYKTKYPEVEESMEVAYSKWIQDLFATYPHPNYRVQSIVFVIIKSILESAKDLSNKASILINNDCFTDSFINDLDKLIHCLEQLNDKYYMDNDYFRLSTIEEGVDLLAQLFPEYKNYFFDKWNHGKMEKQFGLPGITGDFLQNEDIDSINYVG